MFKKLWEDCGGTPNAAKVIENIQKHKTVVWPSSEEAMTCLLQRPLYGSTITPFVLEEWNRSLGGDQPTVKPWVEHVLPETFSKDWEPDFTEEQHKKLKDLLANLLPLSQPMNQGFKETPDTLQKDRSI